MRTRIRSIKPEFFVNFKLDRIAKESGLPVHRVFSGLWIVADRDGRFEWLPHELQLNIMPYDDHSLFLDTLNALLSDGYIIRYEFVTSSFGYIPGWSKHQRPRADEAKSVIPSPDSEGVDIVDVSGVPSRVRNESVTNSRRGSGSGSGSGNGSKNPQTPKGGSGTSSKPDPIPYDKIIGHLNERTGSNFRTNGKATRAIIKARIKDGYTPEDLMAVIDSKCGEWMSDTKMSKYLKPDTLFRGSKFESYIGQVNGGGSENHGY